ncbi:MAG: alpha/beta fold hydrolase [Maritimibacter sp.]
MLATQSFGSDTTLPPILIVHGLFGSGRNWGVIAKRLSQSRRVLSVDMRNHGDSFRAESQSYADMAGDLAEVIAAHGGIADVIGHSMGGKAAMVLALTRPDTVRRLLIADIAPVSYPQTGEHHALIAAMKALDLSAIETRGDADRALAAAIPSPSVRAFLLQSLDVKGKVWRLNLDVLDRELPSIRAFPELSGEFSGPTLFLAGGVSDYILPEHRATIRALFPAAKQAKRPGVGHWLHAEKPRDFEATAEVFLGGE